MVFFKWRDKSSMMSLASVVLFFPLKRHWYLVEKDSRCV